MLLLSSLRRCFLTLLRTWLLQNLGCSLSDLMHSECFWYFQVQFGDLHLHLLIAILVMASLYTRVSIELNRRPQVGETIERRQANRIIERKKVQPAWPKRIATSLCEWKENLLMHKHAIYYPWQIIKMLTTVVAMFAICWLPYHFYFILIYFSESLRLTGYGFQGNCKLPMP